MASGHKPLDPLRPARYTLLPSESLSGEPQSANAYSSVRYNFKPKAQAGVDRKVSVTTVEGDRLNLSLTDRSANTSAKYSFTGKEKELKQSFALVFNESDSTCKLERLTHGYTFNVQSTPTESSPTRLAEKHPKLKPKEETLGESGEQNASSEEVDPNGSPDENNPFDYRHFTRRVSLGSPSSPDSGESVPGSPVQKAHLTATNATKQAKQLSKKPRARTPPVGTTLSKAKNGSQPSVRLDRRASMRPSEEKATKKSQVSGAKTSVKSSYYVDSDTDDNEAEAVSTRGGLEIDFGDAPPSRKRGGTKSKKAMGMVANRARKGPISLQSAANSTTASPAQFLGTPKRSHKSNDVIDFGELSAKSSDDAGYDEDDEGDEDIEPMMLGSPAHITAAAEQNQRQDDDDDALADEFEKEMAAGFEGDGAGVEDADLEKEIIDGLTSQDDTALAGNAIGHESEESEEE